MKVDPVDSIPREAQDEAWPEIETALDDLGRLAGSTLAPAELHREMLARLVKLLAAEGGIVWQITSDAPPSLECQLGPLVPALEHDLSRHQQLAAAVADSREARLVGPTPSAVPLGEVSSLLIFCPLTAHGTVHAVVEILQRQPADSAAMEAGYLRLLRTACEVVEPYHARRDWQRLMARHGELAELVEYQQRVHQQLELSKAAATIVNETRRMLGCDRVTLITRAWRGPRVAAVSGVESFDRHSGVVLGLQRVAVFALAAGEPLLLPEQADAIPPAMAEQTERLLDESHARSLGLWPVFRNTADEDEPPVGLLACEWFAAVPNAEQRLRAARLAQASGPALANALVYDGIPLRRTLEMGARAVGLSPGRGASPVLVGIALAIGIALALSLIPVRFSVEARGRLMPTHRRQVFAPSDAIVVELPAREGERVAAGQVLARLHSPALDIDESELIGKQRTAEEDLRAAQTAALRSEVEEDRTTARGQLTARVEQLKETLRGLAEQLRIVREQQASLNVHSPLTGIVTTWDAERQLAGRPVKRGDALLTVADVAGAWELLLDVPDRRAGHVLAAARDGGRPLEVTFQLGTDPGTVRRGMVASIAPSSETLSDAGPAVRIVAALSESTGAPFRPGATVVARIQCGRRSLGYVWLHELWEAIRLRIAW